MVGDFNIPDMRDMTGCSHYTEEVVNLFLDLNLLQIIDEPTHIRGNILDLCFTSDESACSYAVHADRASDHYPISISISMADDYNAHCDFFTVYSKSSFRPEVFFNASIPLFQLCASMSIPNFDEFVHDWYDAATGALHNSLQIKRLKRTILPSFYSSHTVHLLNKAGTCRRKLAKDARSPQLESIELDLCHSLELDKITLLQSFGNYALSDCFKFLRLVNKRSPIPQTIKWERQIADTDFTKAELFNSYFASVYDSASVVARNCVFHTDAPIKLDDATMSIDIIEHKLSKVADSNNAVADGIPPFILRLNAALLAPVVMTFFSQIIRFRTWPDIWKCAQVLPYHKSGSKSDVKTSALLVCCPNYLSC